MTRRRNWWMAISFLVAGWDAAAKADNIDFTHVTILDHSTPFNATFDVNNIAANNAVWPARGDYGYASQGQGAETFVDFMFDQPYTLTQVTFVDRLESAAAPPNLGGTLDYVTEFDLILSQNETFGDADDMLILGGPFEVPMPPLEIDDFVHVIDIPSVTAQYIRYNVFATQGANPGAHTFLFETSDIVTPVLPELQIDRATGEISLHNSTGGPITFIAYHVESATVGALDTSNWTSIAAGGDMDSGGSIDPTDNWIEFTPAPSIGNLSEAELPGGDGVTLDRGSSIDLGDAWIRNPTEDLAIQLQAPDGTFIETTIVYAGDALMVADFDFNGVIDVGDWMIFRSGMGTISPDASVAQSYQFGDLDGDRDNDIHDFRAFLAAFDAANGAGAFAAIAGVPEPSTMGLGLALATAVALSLWRRRARTCTAFALAGISFVNWSPARVLAENIDFTHITVVDNAVPFNATFDVSNIATNNANWPSTDGFGYASQGQAADTYVDFMFDQPYTLDNITVVDRLHSAANATTLGGVADYVTEFDLILSLNSIFGDGDDVIMSEGPFEIPPTPRTVDDFIQSVDISSVMAQYVRYDVVATAGGNPGAHTLLFSTTDVVPPAGIQLEVNKTTGQLTLQNTSPVAVTEVINAYEITSAAGALNPAGWTGLGSLSEFPAGDGSGNGWEMGGGSNSNLLIEAFLLGSSTIEIGDEFSLGAGYDAASGAEDLPLSTAWPGAT